MVVALEADRLCITYGISRLYRRADPGLFELKKARRPRGFGYMDASILNGPKDPNQHIKKVNAYVCCDSARFADVAFPGEQVPPAAGCNVSQVNIVFLRRSRDLNFPFQGRDGWMEAQLQDIVYPSAGLGLDSGQGHNVTGIED